jgi:hypothetical protein
MGISTIAGALFSPLLSLFGGDKNEKLNEIHAPKDNRPDETSEGLADARTDTEGQTRGGLTIQT